MLVLKLSPLGLAKGLVDGVKSYVVGEALAPLTALVDGKLTIRGFHDHLAPARPETMAALLAQDRPAFSSAATHVRQDPGGVTSYDITPGLGPKFAYSVAAMSHFTAPSGAALSVVELRLGDQRGAASDYEGRAYHVFGQGPRGAWAAELWDGVKTDGAFADATATLGHNTIVDGALGRNGFRGLARAALRSEQSGAAIAPPQLPAVSMSPALLAFVGSAEHVPALTARDRAELVAVMRASREVSPEAGAALQRFEDARAPVPQPGPRPPAAGSVSAGPLARFQLGATRSS